MSKRDKGIDKRILDALDAVALAEGELRQVISERFPVDARVKVKRSGGSSVLATVIDCRSSNPRTVWVKSAIRNIFENTDFSNLSKVETKELK